MLLENATKQEVTWESGAGKKERGDNEIREREGEESDERSEIADGKRVSSDMRQRTTRQNIHLKKTTRTTRFCCMTESNERRDGGGDAVLFGLGSSVRDEQEQGVERKTRPRGKIQLQGSNCGSSACFTCVALSSRVDFLHPDALSSSLHWPLYSFLF